MKTITLLWVGLCAIVAVDASAQNFTNENKEVASVIEASNSDITVFPNMAHKVVFIHNAGSSSVSAVQLLGTNGSTIKQWDFNNMQRISLNVADVPAGSYTLKVVTDNTYSTHKLIVE